MTNRSKLDTLKELRRDIALILDGQTQPTIGATLVIAVADWLRQFNPPNLDEANLDEMRIQILMRFLKGVADEIGLGMEFGQLVDDDDLPTLGNA